MLVFFKTNSISDHCQWPSITCNDDGLVTEIHQYEWDECSSSYEMDITNLNLSSLAPSLILLDLSGRGIGTIPSEIGMFSNLKYLSLASNYLTGELPLEIGNLTQLLELDVSYNQLNGSIPPALRNLTYLQTLSLSSNSFSGKIPPWLGLLSNLSHLSIFSNYLVGSIPFSIANLTQLRYLDLSHNYLDGIMPPEIGNLMSLDSLSMSHNNLTGSIPSSIGLLFKLSLMDLSHNNLTGSIPSSVGKLTNLQILDLDDNQIGGFIPSEIGYIFWLETLNLSANIIGGELPFSIGNLHLLKELDLSWNLINGEIPSSIGKLQQLDYLDLSHNNLSGQIPSSVASLANDRWNWKNFYVENNNITHQFPKCYNQDNCFSPHKMFYIKLCLSIVLLILGFLLLCLWNHNATKSIQDEAIVLRNKGDLFSIWNFDGNIAFRDIIEATEDFDIRYCIGTGGYGNVYRAQLPTRKVIALKKFHRLEAEEPIFDRCFNNEIRMLTQIRHRNIVKLHGFCLHKRCMFLIYEYMERGSLFCALRNDDESARLDWNTRVEIVKAIAHALAYMHHDCNPPIVHRDLSISNVLLNSELKGFVSDFGTARLLHPDSSNQTVIAGTYGYIAPCKLPYLHILSNY